jgi:hypothetical protein
MSAGAGKREIVPSPLDDLRHLPGLKDATLQGMNRRTAKTHVTVRLRPENVEFLKGLAEKKCISVSLAIDECIDAVRIKLPKSQF